MNAFNSMTIQWMNFECFCHDLSTHKRDRTEMFDPFSHKVCLLVYGLCSFYFWDLYSVYCNSDYGESIECVAVRVQRELCPRKSGLIKWKIEKSALIKPTQTYTHQTSITATVVSLTDAVPVIHCLYPCNPITKTHRHEWYHPMQRRPLSPLTNSNHRHFLWFISETLAIHKWDHAIMPNCE